MKKLIVANLMVLAFLIGCGASMVAQNYIIPPANAQQTTKWDYTCTTSPHNAPDLTALLKEHGAQGWEAISAETTSIVCFKRQM